MIGWGIIGVGDVTEVKAGPAVWGGPRSQLVHVMRRNAELAQDYATRHGVPRWSSDAAAVLDDPEVDAIYIATPTASHADLAIAAARAGKHVLVEKPMAMSVAECDAMIEAAEAAGVRLWVAYYRRALPRFERVRQLIHDGAIGTSRAVTWIVRQQRHELTGWRWDSSLGLGGEFFDAGCHGLDFLDHLFGPATGGTASMTPDAVAGLATWRHGDVVASAEWSYTPEPDLEEMRLIGDDGSITFSVFRPDPILVLSRGTLTEHQIGDPPHVHGPLVAAIVDELHGVGQCPSTGRSARRTSRLIESLLTPPSP